MIKETVNLKELLLREERSIKKLAHKKGQKDQQPRVERSARPQRAMKTAKRIIMMMSMEMRIQEMIERRKMSARMIQNLTTH